MKALLLAGGYGTRLKPLTNEIPKCLAPIQGTPLLEIWLNNLRKFKIGPFLINTHYLNKKVETFVESQPNEDIFLTYEENLLGTAGTLYKNLDFFEGEECLFIHADNLCKVNFHNFIEAHKKRPKKCLFTLMAFRSENPSSCGILELDSSNVVSSFHEKPSNPKSDLANGAIYLLSKEFLQIFFNDYKDCKDFSIDVLPDFMGKIFCYETNDVFIDIGTPEASEKAQNLE